MSGNIPTFARKVACYRETSRLQSSEWPYRCRGSNGRGGAGHAIPCNAMRVLIGYATRFGSTRDIAARIATTIRTTGHAVDLRSVETIAELDHYDAVVFGSGVYDGSWTAEATDVMRRHAAVLASKPVWLFSVGSFGDRHPIVGGLMKKEPKEIGEFEETVHPRDYRVFAGVIALDHWPSWGRLLFKALGGRAGDNRQWPEIEAWAENIAAQLQRESKIKPVSSPRGAG
jgi:menaquinone-dependent protoporphyrinogen oxidase